MAADMTYVCGMIAAKEKYLLKDRILRMCELDAEDAFRMLTESGFGAGETASSPHEYEKLVMADEASIDEFIRAYAPNNALRMYLLLPRDFHNAKAYVKAEHVSSPVEPLLAPDGTVSRETMEGCFKSEDFSALSPALAAAVTEARGYLAEGGTDGAHVGTIFDRAMYKMLSEECSKKKTLRRMIAAKADMQNILTVMRADDLEKAKSGTVEGGTLKERDFERIFSPDGKDDAKYGGETGDFIKLCRAAKEAGRPFTEAERKMASYDEDVLADRKYDLSSTDPFLYYVLRRRAENENVRIVFVCLLNGMPEKDIKARLRAFM